MEVPLNLAEPTASGQAQWWGPPTTINYYHPKVSSVVEQNEAFKELMKREARFQVNKRSDHARGLDNEIIQRSKSFLHHRGCSRESQVTKGWSPRPRSCAVLGEPCTVPNCTVHNAPIWKQPCKETFPQLLHTYQKVPPLNSGRISAPPIAHSHRRSHKKKGSRSRSALGSQFPTLLRSLVADNAELLSNCQKLATEVQRQSQRIGELGR